MTFNRSRRERRNSSQVNQGLEFEALEEKHLLATIVWDNPNPATNGFNTHFGSNATTATQIVEHAIADWERYIGNFNYQDVGDPGQAPVANTYNVDISAGFLTGTTLGVTTVNFATDVDDQDKPFQSSITLDNNAAGAGWYFDTSVAIDSEFPVIVNAFTAGMSNSNSNINNYDLYTTITHELGHAMGIFGHLGAPVINDLMNPSLNPGERRLISDLTMNELVTSGFDGYAHAYTLTGETSYLDNMYVKTIGTKLFVRGTNANDTIAIWQGGDNNMYAHVNGYTERTAVSTFEDFDIKTHAGNDNVYVTSQYFTGYDGGVVDLGTGTDRFGFEFHGSSSYGLSASGDKVTRPYLFVGPSPYHDFTYSGVETVALYGGASGDTITIGNTDAAIAQAFGQGGNDSIMATGSSNTVQMWGGDGNDTLWSGSGNDYINGGAGHDDIRGGFGNDNIDGGDGNDLIYGQNGHDYIHGGNGNDNLHGNGGNDSVFGDAGADTLNFWGPTTTNDYITADWLSPSNQVRVDRRLNSTGGTLVETDNFVADASDFMWIRTLGGNDNVNVFNDVSFMDGIVDGGAGTDTAVVPSNWSKVNVEN